MPVIRERVPSDRGRRDAEHHRERLRREIAESLRERIGEEDIIAAGPEKRVRVPIRSRKRYQFIYDRGAAGGVGQGDGRPGDSFGPPGDAAGSGEAGTEPGEELYEVWLDMAEVEEALFGQLGLPRLKPKRTVAAPTSDIRFDSLGRKGKLLAKKASLRENLLRNARQGHLELGDIVEDDLRYVTYREAPRPTTQAVVFCMMDVSGSIGASEKRISRLFYYWAVRFLRTRYAHVEIVFLAHTTEAFELGEEQFFGRQPSGGTLVSSVYSLAREISRQRFPASDWNIYLLHSSDGDNLASDNQRTFELIREALADASLVGYLEIAGSPGSKRLSEILEAEAIPGLVVCRAQNERDLWPALRQLFARDDVEELVSASGSPA